jgi:hypothetical protein
VEVEAMKVICLSLKLVLSVLFSSVADPDPGSGAFLTLDRGSGMFKKQDLDPGSGSRMNMSLETIYWVKIIRFSHAYADLHPGSENLFDPGPGIRDEKNSYPG